MTSPLKGRFVVFFTVAFDRLGKVNVNHCPAGLEPPAFAKIKRKATVKRPLRGDVTKLTIPLLSSTK